MFGGIGKKLRTLIKCSPFPHFDCQWWCDVTSDPRACCVQEELSLFNSITRSDKSLLKNVCG